MLVVVIGHGRSPEGKGWGPNIDAADIVIRMWNWDWQDKQDYGERYDYGFYEISSTEMARFQKHNCRKPLRSWIATELHSNVGHKRYTGQLPLPTVVVSTASWELEGKILGGVGLKGRLVLTRGCRAACWALDGPAKGQSLILVGFDNVRAGLGLPIAEGFPRAYVEAPGCFPFRDYVGGVRRYGNHDFGVEKPLLNSKAFLQNVKLRFAEDVW